MKVSLPKPKPAYDYTNEVELRRTLEESFSDAQSRREDITLQPNQKFVLTSPDGSQFSLTVDNSGALSATAL